MKEAASKVPLVTNAANELNSFWLYRHTKSEIRTANRESGIGNREHRTSCATLSVEQWSKSNVNCRNIPHCSKRYKTKTKQTL